MLQPVAELFTIHYPLFTIKERLPQQPGGAAAAAYAVALRVAGTEVLLLRQMGDMMEHGDVVLLFPDKVGRQG